MISTRRPARTRRFYQTTVADALAAHKPFVLVFATPAFCRAPSAARRSTGSRRTRRPRPRTSRSSTSSRTSWPTPNGKLQPVLDANGQLQTVDASNQWGLVSEPWIFTVGADGIVKGSFEGVVGDAELKAAIADIAGG